MAIPSGSGTEVLKRNSLLSTNGSGSWTALDWSDSQTDDGNDGNITVAANHVYTILNFSATNLDTAARYFHVKITNSGHDDDLYICQGVDLLHNEIYIWNDKIVLHPLDTFNIYSYSVGIHYYINYLDQDYS